MTGILWLASFPKSGNTWLRAFLANYLADAPDPLDINRLPDFAFGDMRAEPYAQLAGKPVGELSWPEINRLRPQVHHALAKARPGTVFVKTHSVLRRIDGILTITPEVTSGAIYVVRNPLDVAVSFADHYGLTPQEGAKAVCFPGLQIEPRDGRVLQPISDWTTHVRSWRNAGGLYCLVIRYEDMLAAPQETFGGVRQFLKLAKDQARLERAIRHSDFRVLAEQERERGFVERSRNARLFFRRGGVGGWRDALSEADAAMVVERHRPLMTELGYLSAEGRLLV